MTHEWKVEQEDEGARIDKYLVRHFPKYSRSRIQKWIQTGLALVNEKEVSKHHFLDHGDVVRVLLHAEDNGDARPDLDVPSIEVLYEDEAIVVINKPIGLLVHPSGQVKETSVAYWLQSKYPGIEAVGESPERPGIVHRLDKPVSGVMVCAKTQEAFENLKQQFANRATKKEYRAIVHGVPRNEHDVIKLKIARSTTNPGKMAARPEHEEGKAAWTEYDVRQTKGTHFAYLAVSIYTGRTHQIRAHLAAIDHPVVGDKQYASRKYESKQEYERLFLHALTLGFSHPISGEKVSFEAPVPPEFGVFMA